MKSKVVSGIMAILIMFVVSFGVVSTSVVTESISTTEVFYGDARQVFEQGFYVIATETNPVEMYSNYTNKKAYYQMLREHVTTVATTEQFITILVSRGVCPSSGYSVGIESIEKIGSDFMLSANFTEPCMHAGRDCIVLFIITNPVALIPIGNLPDGEYSITLDIDSYEFSCGAGSYFYWGTSTWATSFRVLDPAPDLSIEGILLPYITYVFFIYPTPPPDFAYYINTTVANQGTADAGSFNVSFSAYWEEEELPEVFQKKTIAGLEQGASETVWFDFLPENYGNYTLFIMADCDYDIVELDETNNVKTAWAIGTVGGDMDGDRDVDWVDFGTFASLYGTKFEEPPYYPADIDYDGDVDWEDFGTFVANYGMRVR